MLRASLARAAGELVEVRETHSAVVLLTSKLAYKLRKPVRLPFSDQRDAAERERICRHEAVLDDATAPGLVVGVRAVVTAADGYTLEAAGHRQAVDHVLVMRRFDEGRTLRGLIDARALTDAQARAAGAAIARFHRKALRSPRSVDYLALVDRNFEELLPLTGRIATPLELLALRRLAEAFLLSWGHVLRARDAHGATIDGHGDLRGEHILLEHGTVSLVDRLDLDDLRAVDTCDDLGFLLMDLEAIGARDAARTVLGGYLAAGGEAQPGALLAFFGAYRAQVRAKVALLRGAQPRADRDAGEAEARSLLRLSRRLGWRARDPLILMVTGPPGSGKSTLAGALASASGAPVLSSDAVRVELGTSRYDPADRAAVYAELARRAAVTAGTVLVDATFGEPALQSAFLSAWDDPRPLLAVECACPLEVSVTRAAVRHAAGRSASDAGEVVARRLGRSWSAVRFVAGDDRLVVGTLASPDRQVDQVEAWLDARLAAGPSA